VRISARELRNKELPPLAWIIEDILPAGCTLLTGKSKDGKSMMAYNIVVAVASNGKAFGKLSVMPGSVWYMALEDGERRAQTRLNLQEQQMGRLSDAALDRIAFTLWDAPRLGEGLEDDIRDWILTTPDARLLVIDILEKVRPTRKLNGNIYSEDYQATSSLTKLAQQHNVAILIVHHANKLNATDFRDTSSGAMSLIGGADNFWSLSRQPLSEEATMKVIGRDIEDAQDIAMQFKDGYWTIVGDAEVVKMSKERQAIIDVIKAHGKAMQPKQMADAMGKNYGTTKELARKMLAAGVLIQPVEGYYDISPTYLISLSLLLLL
jgi:RecA-family ATPase